MQVFLGAPMRALVQEARRVVGANCRLVAPAGAARLLQETEHTATDWHGFLRTITGAPFLTQPTPEMVALLGVLAEQLLQPNAYFGKVRTSPQFHNALAHNFCRWSLDGLTPDLLEQGAAAVAQHHALLAELTEPELLQEWHVKTSELCLLWREWQRALQTGGLPEPQRTLQQVLRALESLTEPLPPLLLVGFTELTTFDLQALQRLGRHTQVALALLDDPQRPERYAPTQVILQRLAQQGLAFQTQRVVVTASPAPKLVLLDTPNPLAEVEVVAREILRLRHEGLHWHEIGLLVRQPESLAETLMVIGARYEIPLQGELSLPLTHSWRVRWLMSGLRLLLGTGNGEDWLQWLAHPVLALSHEALHTLRERVRRRLPAIAWLELAMQRTASQEVQRLLQRLNEWRQRLPTQLPEVVRNLALMLEGVTSTQEHDTDLVNFVQLVDAYTHEWQRRNATQTLHLLERLVGTARYQHTLGDTGVRLLPMEYADFAPIRVGCALQVLEGTLPRRHPDDPFLREAERHALNQALRTHRVYLPTRADYQAGEPMLFQRLLSAASERLYLSYPRTQHGESDALPSFYLEELKARYRVEVRFYSLEQIAPHPEACLHPYDQSLSAPPAYAEPPLLLRNQAHRARVATIDRPFSATELETLVRCPFQHFARYVLKVRLLSRGLSLAEVGTIAHATLCRAVRQRPRTLDPAHWIETLTQQLAQLLEDERPDLPEWQLQVLYALVQRLVRRFGWREPQYLAAFGVVPHACEWAFGAPLSDDDERVRLEPLHNSGAPRAVFYPLNNGSQIAIAGVIDRIDLSPDRQVAVVLDYKLGGVPERSDLLEGRAVQGLLYLHAVRTLLRDAHVVLAYDRLKAGRRVRFVPNHPALLQRFRAQAWEDREQCIGMGEAHWRQAEQRLQEKLTEAIERLRRAEIAPLPGDYCRHCAFADLCRQARR